MCMLDVPCNVRGLLDVDHRMGLRGSVETRLKVPSATVNRLAAAYRIKFRHWDMIDTYSAVCTCDS